MRRAKGRGRRGPLERFGLRVCGSLRVGCDRVPGETGEHGHGPVTRFWRSRARAETPSTDIATVRDQAREFAQVLEAKKLEVREAGFWYPYGSMSNFEHLDGVLTDPHRDLAQLVGDDPVADIGGQDGDCSFFLESLGYEVHLFDNPPTTFNRLQGVRVLKEALGSSVQIHEVDLDSRFELPDQRFGLALFFGILYHLKNPFYALETLAERARYCLLSTKVARYTTGGLPIADVPLAYLVDDYELNNDSTNFWIFTEACLRRLLARSGWEVLDYASFGNTTDSDPVTFPEKDERAFCLLRSTRLATA